MLKKIALICFVSFFLFSCTSQQPKDTLRMALSGEPSLLNPLLSTDTSSSSVEGMIFEGLIDVDRDLNYRPLLAERWLTTDQGKTWRFYLKQNVLWHDGKPFTADDVVFTFNKLLDPKTNTVRRSSYVINGQPIKIKKLNDHLLEIKLPEVFAPFELAMTMQIIPEHIYKNEDINRSKFNRAPIGTGPFKFKEWRSGSHIIVERNVNYHRGTALLEKIIFRIIPDTNTQLAALRRGEIDYCGVPPKDHKKLKNNKKLNIYTYDQLFYTYLGLNLANPYFKDKRIRQALAYAINKKQLIKTLFGDLARPAYCPSSPVSWAYTDKIMKFEYSPKKAKELLRSAGFNPNELGVLQKDGQPLKFTLLISQGSRDGQRAAVIIQQYLKDIGIQMEIQVLEWSALLKKINAIQDPKDFDAVLIGWSLGVDPDAYSLWHSSEYPAGFNFIRYTNPQVDQLCIAGRRTTDKLKRKQIYQKLWPLIAEDQPYIFLWYPRSITAVSKKIGGHDTNPGPLGLIDDITRLYIKK